MKNTSNVIEKVLIVIPIINNYKIYKDSFYYKDNIENRKSETISLIHALNVKVLDVLSIKINNFSSANLFNKNVLDSILQSTQKLKISLLIILLKTLYLLSISLFFLLIPSRKNYLRALFLFLRALGRFVGLLNYKPKKYI